MNRHATSEFAPQAIYRSCATRGCMLLALAAVVLCGFVLNSSVAEAQISKVPRRHHRWGRFAPGAWRNVRVTSEQVNGQNEVIDASSTTSTTYLEGIFDESYRLQVEVSVELAGTNYEAPTQFVARGYGGEPVAARTRLTSEKKATLLVEGERVDCEVFEYEVLSDELKQITRIYYSDSFLPHRLRTETEVSERATEKFVSSKVEEVIATQMPVRMFEHTLSTWQMRTVRETDSGKVITIAVHAQEVPGEIISHSSKELDSNGKLIRRSTLELLDYGKEAERRLIRRRGFLRPLDRRNRIKKMSQAPEASQPDAATRS